MKKTLLLLMIAALSACSKDTNIGPTGATGPTGPAGVSGIISTTVTFYASAWAYSPNLKCYYQLYTNHSYQSINDIVIIQDVGDELPYYGLVNKGDTLTYSTSATEIVLKYFMGPTNAGAPKNDMHLQICIIPPTPSIKKR